MINQPGKNILNKIHIIPDNENQIIQIENEGIFVTKEEDWLKIIKVKQ